MRAKYIDPNTVFTPRGSKVTQMYVHRSALEERVSAALGQNQHILIHGESGCGKTWLYKKVLGDGRFFCKTINLGLLNSVAGLPGLLEETLASLSERTLSQLTEGKSAGISAAVASGELTSERVYSLRQKNIYLSLVAEISRQAGKKQGVLILENLEHIIGNEAALKDLKGLLLLVDDDDFAKYSVRVVLVTTAQDFRSYLSDVGQPSTLKNRIKEVPEVGRLLPKPSQDFVTKGLFSILGLGVSGITKEFVVDWVVRFTDRIPQYLHELCLEVALASVPSGRVLTKENLTAATLNWIRSSLIGELTAVTSNLNSIATRKGRRNQILYAISQCEGAEFDYAKIERIVRANFAKDCDGVKLNVSQVLSELAASRFPIIKRVSHGTGYRVIDPRYKILLCWALQKDSDGALVVRSFGDGETLRG